MDDLKLIQKLIKAELEEYQKELKSGTSYQKEVLAKRDVFETLANMIARVIAVKEMREDNLNAFNN